MAQGGSKGTRGGCPLAGGLWATLGFGITFGASELQVCPPPSWPWPENRLPQASVPGWGGSRKGWSWARLGGEEGTVQVSVTGISPWGATRDSASPFIHFLWLL